MRFIVACADGDESMAAICRRHGISRKTGYKLLKSYEERGVAAFEDRPPIPRTHPLATPVDVADALVAARKLHPTWGPKKLREWLSGRDARRWPSPSTIGEVLKRYGLIRPRRRRPRMPPGQSPLERGASPNDVWCTDFKGHFAFDKSRTRCHPLTITDEASRYLIGCEGLAAPKHEPTQWHFERVLREFGLPIAIRSDNGAPFASTAPGGLSRLSVWWIRLGIKPLRIDPGQPQQNGVHERMHRTLKEEATIPPQADMASQQRVFDRFRAEYNDERPHEALGMKTPARVYSVSPRSMPDRLHEPEYASGHQHRRCDQHGRAALHGHIISFSTVLASAVLGVREVADGREEIFYGPILLGWFDRTRSEPRFERA